MSSVSNTADLLDDVEGDIALDILLEDLAEPLPQVANAGSTPVNLFVDEKPSASVEGYKYIDTDGDQLRDGDETGGAGVTIKLMLGDKEIAAVTTGDDGYFSFSDLEPGDYTLIEVVPVGSVATTPVSVPVTIEAGENKSLGNVFGNQPAHAAIELDKSVRDVFNKDGSIDADGIVDAVGDVVLFEFKVKNAGNVALEDVELSDVFEDDAETPLPVYESGDLNNDQILDVGEEWTYALRHTVTEKDLKDARKAVAEVTKSGFFTCVVYTAMGDLELDNTALVTAKFGDTEVSSYDTEAVEVSKGSLCLGDDRSLDGGSAAEMLAAQLQSAG